MMASLTRNDNDWIRMVVVKVLRSNFTKIHFEEELICTETQYSYYTYSGVLENVWG